VIFENFLKFSKRRRAVPLRLIWTIIVAAKLDQSGVLVTKFCQNRLTLKGRSADQRHTQTDKPVGFYGPIAPPVPNAPSSRICGQNPRNDADATFLDPHISVVDCGCTPLHSTIGGRLREWQNSKCISSISLVRIESNFFTIHRRQTQKNDGPEF